MDELGSLSHARWECISDVASIPKCREIVLYERLRKHLGVVPSEPL